MEQHSKCGVTPEGQGNLTFGALMMRISPHLQFRVCQARDTPRVLILVRSSLQ